jgi:hypothetical protein
MAFFKPTAAFSANAARMIAFRSSSLAGGSTKSGEENR